MSLFIKQKNFKVASYNLLVIDNQHSLYDFQLFLISLTQSCVLDVIFTTYKLLSLFRSTIETTMIIITINFAVVSTATNIKSRISAFH